MYVEFSYVRFYNQTKIIVHTSKFPTTQWRLPYKLVLIRSVHDSISLSCSLFFLSHPGPFFSPSNHGFHSPPPVYLSYSPVCPSFVCIFLHFFIEVVTSVGFFSPALTLAFSSFSASLIPIMISYWR